MAKRESNAAFGCGQAQKAKRSPISKKLRFEVFKRDSFTCQYCGAKAPDVLLHADHIKPAVDGGRNTLVNLVTACESCNLGKGARRLSDKSAAVKSQREAERQQTRIEQIRMIAQWHEDLAAIDAEMVSAVSAAWVAGTGMSPNDNGRNVIRGWLRIATFEEVMQAVDIAIYQYVKTGKDGVVLVESWERAFSRVVGIIKHRRIEKTKPYHSAIMYARGIIRNRFGYVPHEFYKSCEHAMQNGLSREELLDYARDGEEIEEILGCLSALGVPPVPSGKDAA